MALQRAVTHYVNGIDNLDPDELLEGASNMDYASSQSDALVVRLQTATMSPTKKPCLVTQSITPDLASSSRLMAA